MENDNNTISKSSPATVSADEQETSENKPAPSSPTPLPENDSVVIEPAEKEEKKNKETVVKPATVEIGETEPIIPSEEAVSEPVPPVKEETVPVLDAIEEKEAVQPEKTENEKIEEKIEKEKALEKSADVKPAPATSVNIPRATKPTPAPKFYDFKKEFKSKLRNLLQIANQERSKRVEENLEKIYEYAKGTQRVTNDDVERLTDVSDRQALRYLKILVKKKKLVRFGTGKNNFYKPIIK